MTTEADHEAVRSPDRLAVLVLGIARSAGTRVQHLAHHEVAVAATTPSRSQRCRAIRR